MPSGVTVRIEDRLIISALNTPGGGVYEWRDEVGHEIRNKAIEFSPINNPMNAVHRGEEVGLYKTGWSFDRLGSRGHHVVARVSNDQDYAIYVEWGRTPSTKLQIFSWTEYEGGIVRVGGPTKPADWQIAKWKGKGFRRFVERAAWEDLPKWIGKKTAAREGYHVLGRATVAVLGSLGITARTDM